MGTFVICYRCAFVISYVVVAELIVSTRLVEVFIVLVWLFDFGLS